MRVVVTRPAEQAGPLAKRLEELGHQVAICPLIAVRPLGDAPIDLSAYDWVVVTSANGARELARRLHGRLLRVAAIGPGTAATLEEHGIAVDLIPAVSTQEGLVEALRPLGGRIAYVGAAGARGVLRDELGADYIAVYETVPLQPAAFPDADLVALASASAARSYARLGVDVPAVSIGPQTTAAALEHGVEILAEASTHDLEGLVAAVDEAAAASA